MKKYIAIVAVLATIVLMFSLITVNGATFYVDKTGDASQLITKFSAVDYSPYRTGQGPESWMGKPTEAQIKEDIKILQKITDEIRTYGVDATGQMILKVCKESNMKITLSCWLGPDKELTKSVENGKQVAQLIKLATDPQYQSVIDTLIVGSEVLYREDMPATRLLEYLNQVKTAVKGSNIKVTCADTYGALVAQPDVINAVDVVLYHVHPLWEKISIENAAARVMTTWDELHTKYPTKPIVIGETGWPTQGRTFGDAVPTVENQLYFMKDLYQKIKDHKDSKLIKVFYFSAFDENWKSATDEGDFGGFWGLYNIDRTPKAGLKALFPILDDGKTPTPSNSIEPTISPTPIDPNTSPTPKPWITVKPSTTPIQTIKPTADAPVIKPTDAPVIKPTDAPVIKPTNAPIIKPTDAPIIKPTDAPIIKPTDAPIIKPTDAPIIKPTDAPIIKPTDAPVVNPTDVPAKPTTKPSAVVIVTSQPTQVVNPAHTDISPSPNPTTKPVDKLPNTGEKSPIEAIKLGMMLVGCGILLLILTKK